MDGAPRLTLAELAANAPPTTASWGAEAVTAAVIRDELRAGRLIEGDGGFTLELGRWIVTRSKPYAEGA